MRYVVTRMPPDDLRHYGTKGQHWGHRKYQHKDGTWTPEGQKRYSTDTDGEYGEPGGEREYKPKTERQIKKDLEKQAKQQKRRKRGRDVAEKQSKKKLTPSQKVINTGFKALNAYWAIDSFRSDWM